MRLSVAYNFYQTQKAAFSRSLAWVRTKTKGTKIPCATITPRDRQSFAGSATCVTQLLRKVKLFVQKYVVEFLQESRHFYPNTPTNLL